MSSPDQLSLDDLMGIEVPESPKEASAQEKALKKAQKILLTWSKKSGRSQTSVTAAHNIFADLLVQGVDEQSLRYVISQPKPMLSSAKKITHDMVQRALDEVETDKARGRSALRIFEPWYEEYYANRYTQNPGIIMSTIKKALVAGSEEDLKIAMNLLGKRRQVVSENSLQYALTQVDQMRARGTLNGIDSFTQDEIFSQRKISLNNPQEQFSAGGFFDSEPQQDDNKEYNEYKSGGFMNFDGDEND